MRTVRITSNEAVFPILRALANAAEAIEKTDKPTTIKVLIDDSAALEGTLESIDFVECGVELVLEDEAEE